jgi:hypothetical protein
LLELDESGKILQHWALPVSPPSMVVYPNLGAVYFPQAGELRGMALANGEVLTSDLPAMGVAGDPLERMVYSYVKEESRSPGPMILGGRPVFFNTPQDWRQSTLFAAKLAGDEMLLAGIRLNAASNAYRVTVSPDGAWAALPGGGGWRPESSQNGGCKIAVFSTHNVRHVQGAFNSDAYPKGVAFNPVTQQVAVVREKDARVYHLTSDAKDASEVVCEGPFSGIGVWSGRGDVLYLAGKENGVRMVKNGLSKSEKSYNWWAKVEAKRKTLRAPRQSTASSAAPFRHARDRRLSAQLSCGQQHCGYQQDAQLRNQIG